MVGSVRQLARGGDRAMGGSGGGTALDPGGARPAAGKSLREAVARESIPAAGRAPDNDEGTRGCEASGEGDFLADFPGCKRIPMNREEYMTYEGRLEHWDGDTKTAWVVEAPTSPTHEQPGGLLPSLATIISLTRGAQIKCYGSVDLIVRDEFGARHKVMQADQTLYKHPGRAKLSGEGVEIAGDTLPDVVLEVDHTTDVRRGKLRLYESWGIPELWVDTPDKDYAVNRPAALRPGLTIYLLENGVYRKSAVSRAFPGWTAAEIHKALNEREMSAETQRVLDRVGEALGKREGTGPDDTHWLRDMREKAKWALLIQLAEKRFGAATARQLSDLLRGAKRPVRTSDAANWLIDCETGTEFIKRVTARTRHE